MLFLSRGKSLGAQPKQSRTSSMDRCQRLFVLLLGWSYFCCGHCAVLKTSFVGFSKDAEFGQKVEDKQHVKKTEQDTLSEHMQMLYAKYNSAGFPLKDGNTVRSFKAHSGRPMSKINFASKREIVKLY